TGRTQPARKRRRANVGAGPARGRITMKSNGLNRRDFLKAAVASGAVLVAGGALAGCAPSGGGNAGGSGDATGAENLVGVTPVSFEDETDVLILGTGIAGLSAAMDPVEA